MNIKRRENKWIEKVAQKFEVKKPVRDKSRIVKRRDNVHEIKFHSTLRGLRK
jgi:hypothetical protein